MWNTKSFRRRCVNVRCSILRKKITVILFLQHFQLLAQTFQRPPLTIHPLPHSFRLTWQLQELRPHQIQHPQAPPTHKHNRNCANCFDSRTHLWQAIPTALLYFLSNLIRLSVRMSIWRYILSKKLSNVTGLSVNISQTLLVDMPFILL